MDVTGVPDLTGLREPQSGWEHLVVPAVAATPWPNRDLRLDVRVAGAGRVLDLAEFHEVTSTTAFVVVVDGVLVHERYADGVGPADRLLGNSATKSVLAQLVGLAVDSGALPDLDAPVRRHVPDLAGSGWADVTVRQLLHMTSCTGWTEDLRDPHSAAARMVRGWRSGAGGLREVLRGVPAGPRPPGTAFSYSTGDSQVLDWVRETATGQTYPQALAVLWERLGAEQPAVVGLDAPAGSGGVPVAGAALAACARDWARLGVLQLDGRWQGEQLLSPRWLAVGAGIPEPFLAPGRLPSTITTHAGFSAHWWPLDAGGRRTTADGMRGQFVYVDRALRTVVVKTSAWPYDDPWADRQCRDLCYLVLPAVAEAASAAAAGRHGS